MFVFFAFSSQTFLILFSKSGASIAGSSKSDEKLNLTYCSEMDESIILYFVRYCVRKS